MNTEKFLEFNGNKLTLVKADGSFWIAIKPICEALKIDYQAQFRRIKEDVILSKVVQLQHYLSVDNKNHKMCCLPEKYIYGWIFSINSNSEDLLIYQKKFLEVLANNFTNG